MEKLYRYSAIILLIFSLLAFLDWSHAYTKMSWALVPSILLIWIVALISVVLSMLAFINRPNKKVKLSHLITPLLCVVLTIYLLIPLLQDLNTEEELIHTTESPYGTFKINFYAVNGGAEPFRRIVGKLDGPLWFKKNIYYEQAQDEVTVNWLEDQLIAINQHTLNLAARETYPMPDKEK